MEARKLYCSCIRRVDLQARIDSGSDLQFNNSEPREGDVVVARVDGDVGAYMELESRSGRSTTLRRSDLVIGVLGCRRSGTNITAALPKGVQSGDLLHLVSAGGLVARADFVPHYYGGQALPLEIIGFPSFEDRILNLRDFQRLVTVGTHRRVPTVVVAGTSAEVGKTTTVREMVAFLKTIRPQLKIAAIKATGTGRVRDLLAYRSAGANCAIDFVEGGYPSTYGIGSEDYVRLVERLIDVASEHADVVLVEIGGDLLEGRAPEALSLVGSHGWPLILVANDALGAMAGVELLLRYGVGSPFVATIRQSTRALADRLRIARAFDPLCKGDIIDLATRVLGLNAR